MKSPVRAVVCALAFFAGLMQVKAQDTQQLVIHITSVRFQDAQDMCQSGTCAATRITIEGYSVGQAPIEYVANCVEVEKPGPVTHDMFVCPRLHAGSDYVGRYVGDSLFFGDNKKESNDAPSEAGYNIVSEAEGARKPSK